MKLKIILSLTIFFAGIYLVKIGTESSTPKKKTQQLLLSMDHEPGV